MVQSGVGLRFSLSDQWMQCYWAAGSKARDFPPKCDPQKSLYPHSSAAAGTGERMLVLEIASFGAAPWVG